jgi:hypothetical protein
MQVEFVFDEPKEDKRDKGFICPCCNQFTKRYTRSFNSNMAFALMFLYRNREKGFIHLENAMKEQGHQRCGDASYLRHYRLIEAKQEDRTDGSNRNGMYKISGTGIMFCEMKLKVQEKFLIFNNKCEGFTGKEVDILETIGNKFNYNDLMNKTNTS